MKAGLLLWVWRLFVEGIQRLPVSWRMEARMPLHHMMGPVELEVAAEIHDFQPQQRFVSSPIAVAPSPPDVKHAHPLL
jgi:hypothetical protein